MQDATRIAVLMTCYNRREKTLDCLHALTSQTGIEDTSMHVYLVDDGCTDGTGESVRQRYPMINLLHGNGNLYWCGGMRLAFAEAMKGDYDYYLWLNDDTNLYPLALCTMLETIQKVKEISGKGAIIVGSTCDANTGEPTYGGVLRTRRFGFMRIAPGATPKRCDTMNGNIVLIPREIATAVGNISGAYTQLIGDYDYGLRAARMGYFCWVAPGFVGTCQRNDWRGSFRDGRLPMRQRLSLLHRPTEVPRLVESMVFSYQHGGICWPLLWMRILARTLFPRAWLILRSRMDEQP